MPKCLPADLPFSAVLGSKVHTIKFKPINCFQLFLCNEFLNIWSLSPIYIQVSFWTGWEQFGSRCHDTLPCGKGTGKKHRGQLKGSTHQLQFLPVLLPLSHRYRLPQWSGIVINFCWHFFSLTEWPQDCKKTLVNFLLNWILLQYFEGGVCLTHELHVHLLVSVQSLMDSSSYFEHQ